MNVLQQLAAAELVWVELSLELAYHDECVAFLQGRTDETPDPREYGLSEALACQIAVEAGRAEAESTAASFDAMADTVREPMPWHQRAAG